MASIKYRDNILNFEMDCIKFIKVNDMLTFYHRCINGDVQIFDEHDFFNFRSIIILPHTKWKDIFTFNKTNILGKYLTQVWQEKSNKLFNENVLESVMDDLKKFNEEIEINSSIDFLKVISLLIDFNAERNVNKNDLLGLINLVAENNHDTRFIFFNYESLDEDIVRLLLQKNIKTLIVFNELFNLSKIIQENKNDVILFKKDKFIHYDFKNNVDEDINENIDKIFLKI